MSISVLVYATEKTANSLTERLASEARPGWDKLIRIRSLPTAQHLANKASGWKSPEDDISRVCSTEQVNRVLVEKALKIPTAKLKAQGIRIRACMRATIEDELLQEARRLRLHWLSHSTNEWEKAGIRHLPPNAWQQQFDEFGQSWIAEGILKQLNVISDADLRTGLIVPEQETLGMNTCHGCILDQSPGSSSVNVRDLLEHTYPFPVQEINLLEQPKEMENVDHLYLYEDGLWSGVELVERLQLLANWPLVRSRQLRVTFRFAATSEAGLSAARYFIKREKLTSLAVSAGQIAHFNHLRSESSEILLQSPMLDDAAVRKIIDKGIKPLAFMENSIWRGRSQAALSFCKAIGEQLVRPWIVRTKGIEGIDEQVTKWALGAYDYASVTSFSKSVPKPVLPLIWLNGQVAYEGRVVNWRPLFWDSRRTGSAPPSLHQRSAF